jgi:hypothetical protein
MRGNATTAIEEMIRLQANNKIQFVTNQVKEV